MVVWIFVWVLRIIPLKPELLIPAGAFKIVNCFFTAKIQTIG